MSTEPKHYLAYMLRLWQFSSDAGLPAAVASILEVSPEGAENLLAPEGEGVG
jgi:hypothetical protein